MSDQKDFTNMSEQEIEDSMTDYQDKLDKEILERIEEEANTLENIKIYTDLLIDETNDDTRIQVIKDLIESMGEISYFEARQIGRVADNLYWDNSNFQGGGYYDNWQDDHYRDVDRGNNERVPYTGFGKHNQGFKQGNYSTPPATKNPDFITLNKDSITTKLKISMSPLATIKLFTMMKYFDNIEWGAYLKLDKALPQFDDLYLEDKKWEINVIDLVLIPQVRSSAHVEYLENELPEFMEEWRDCKVNGFYVNSGRVHSHHTLGAYHSGTDLGEFEEAHKNSDRMLSIVSSFKKGSFKQKDDLAKFDTFFQGLDFDTKLFIPLVGDMQKSIKANFGYLLTMPLWLSPYDLEDVQEATNWLGKFLLMDTFVKDKYPLIKTLIELAEREAISDIDLYNNRKIIIENDGLFSIMSDFVELLGTINKKANTNNTFKKKIEEITKLIEK